MKDNAALIHAALTRNAEPLARSAGHALITAVVVGGILALPALALWVINPLLAAAYVGLPSLAWLLQTLSLRAKARARRLDLERALGEHLARRGVALEDTSGAAELARADFWRQAQVDALMELRRRQLPDDVPLLTALPTVWRAQRGVLLAAGLGWGVITGLIGLFIALDPTGGTSTSIFCMVFSAILYGAAASYWLGARLLGGALHTANQRRELEREIRHVAHIMDAAGGLSLAEHEIESTLHGALSSHAVQIGELEEVKS